jgi:hypothetical protein
MCIDAAAYYFALRQEGVIPFRGSTAPLTITRVAVGGRQPCWLVQRLLSLEDPLSPHNMDVSVN